MVLNYFGDGCFRLQSGDLSVLVNPNSNRLKADVVLKTLSLPESPVEPEVIACAGEYEVKGIEIEGIQVPDESTAKYIKTVYAVTWEEMKFVFLGHISKPLSAAFVEDLGEPDILFIPTGDDHFISPEDAARMIKQFEPKVVVPAFFKSASDLLKVLGVKAEAEEKMVFKKKDIADFKNKLILLESKS